MTDKKPVGRPRKTLDDLPKGWKEKMLKEAAEGAADIELRMYVLGGIAFETWDRLMQDNPEFLETVQRCRNLSKAWWIKQGRINLKEKDFNYNGYKMNMQNRYGEFSDSLKVSGDKDNPLQVEHSISEKTLDAISHKLKTVEDEF